MSNPEIDKYLEKSSNERTKINFLIQQGLVIETIGSPKDTDVFSFATWIRKPPGEYLLYYIGIARFLNPKAKLIMVADDLLSKAIFRRTDQEQEKYNTEYKTYIENNGEAEVIFSSDFLTSGEGLSGEFLRMASNVSLNSFMQLLPEGKRKSINNITSEEFVHAVSHLLVLDHLAELSQTLITGKTTRAIIAEHRNIKKSNALSSVLVPFFNTSEETHRHIALINQYRQLDNGFSRDV